MANNKKYDFLIVGAGFAGASCARLLTDKGYKCLIIEERPFVSGNCVTEKQNGIFIHFFGGHILHTNNADVWNFLKIYGDIHEYRYPIIGWNDGRTYRLPIGMDLIQSLYEVAWPYEAETKLVEDKVFVDKVKSIEDYALANFGNKIYETTIQHFYEKMFGMKCSEIPYQCMVERKIDLLKYSNSYYQDAFQGMPEEGYKTLVENMIGDDIDIILNTNFLNDKEKYMSYATYTIYTGELDKFFNYCMGPLSWVSASFNIENSSDLTSNLSGTPIVNFCGIDTEWYRMTEHKWLTPWFNDDETNDEYKTHTFVTYESFNKWEKDKDPFYPIYSEKSVNLYKRYLAKLHEKYPNVFLCGRRAKYTFWHICDVIEDAMNLTSKFPEKS